MGNQLHADLATRWVDSLPLLRRQGRDVMLLVSEEPLTGVLLELAYLNGFDAFACRTPLDVIDTLVELGDRVACAVLSTGATWSTGLPDFIADEYPHIQRVVVDA